MCEDAKCLAADYRARRTVSSLPTQGTLERPLRAEIYHFDEACQLSALTCLTAWRAAPFKRNYSDATKCGGRKRMPPAPRMKIGRSISGSAAGTWQKVSTTKPL